jgi:hypothetical protein
VSERLFVLIGWDGADGPQRRPEQRPAHLANCAPLDAAGGIVHGGPLLDESGSPIGSVIVFAAKDLESARAFAAADPYVTGGVFERHVVYETRAVFPGGD